MAEIVTETTVSDLRFQLLGAVTDSVLIRSLSGTILYANAAAERLYGWKSADMVGRDFTDVFRAHRPVTLTTLQNILILRGSWRGEFKRNTASGTLRRIDARWHPLVDRNGSIEGIIEYARDITDLNAIEQESRRQAHRYQNLFQAMAASFWEIDFSAVRQMMAQLHQAGVTDFRAYFAAHPDFVDQAIAASRVVDVNDKTVQLFGANSRADMVEGNLTPYWPPQSRDLFRDSLLASINRQNSLSRETQLSTLDGRTIDALFTVCWPSGHDERGTVLVGVIDLTDRVAAEREARQSHDRYRSLFQAMTTALLEVDTSALMALFETLRLGGVMDIDAHMDAHPDFLGQALQVCRVTDANPAAACLYGAGSVDALIGHPLTRLWPSSSHTVVRRALATGFYESESFEMDTRTLRFDGREVDIVFTLNASKELRQRQRVLLGLTDISERVQAQTAIQQLQSEFAHASRLSMLGELTASIAHEVNQPLTAIAANAAAANRWLGRDAPDLDQLRSIGASIGADARRAADIIANVRGLASNQQPERIRLDVNQTLEDALRFLRHELLGNGVDVRLSLTRPLPEVLADRTQIQQVVVNLMLNAVQELHRAPPDGAPMLTISSHVIDGFVQVDIADNGPGIAPEHEEKLFQSFFTTKATGLGMGLSICRTMLENLGGRIWAVNTGTGACFSFALPVTADLRIQ